MGLNAPLNSPGEWQAYRAALETVRVRRRASTAWAALASLRQGIEQEIRKGQAPPELPAAVAALSARDVAGYARCLESLAEAHGERLRQLRCDALAERLAAAHPALAANPAIVPEEWDDALDLGVRLLVSDGTAAVPAGARTRGDPRTGHRTGGRSRGLPVATEAWGWALSRVAGRPSASALPVWIMPLGQVPTSVPGARDSFDVVVVDSAGEGVDALFLLWLAPRVIIVGEGAPVPSDATVTPDSTLFGALAARFPVMESGVVATPHVISPVRPPEPDPRQAAPAEEPDLRTRPVDRHLPAAGTGRARHPARLRDQEPHRRAAHRVRPGAIHRPEDEHLIVGARLRYAVEAMRAVLRGEAREDRLHGLEELLDQPLSGADSRIA